MRTVCVPSTSDSETKSSLVLERCTSHRTWSFVLGRHVLSSNLNNGTSEGQYQAESAIAYSSRYESEMSEAQTSRDQRTGLREMPK
jgi:hypothetical protein